MNEWSAELNNDEDKDLLNNITFDRFKKEVNSDLKKKFNFTLRGTENKKLVRVS